MRRQALKDPSIVKYGFTYAILPPNDLACAVRTIVAQFNKLKFLTLWQTMCGMQFEINNCFLTKELTDWTTLLCTTPSLQEMILHVPKLKRQSKSRFTV